MKKLGLILVIVLCGLKVSAQTPVNDTLKFNAEKKNISIFLKLMSAAGLDSSFTGKPLTIFAPDDKAFGRLPAGILDTLLKPTNKQALILILNNDIVSGKITAANLSKLIHKNNGQTVLTTVSGNKLTAKINANRNLILVDKNGGETIVKQFDLHYGNANLFTTDSVLISIKIL